LRMRIIKFFNDFIKNYIFSYTRIIYGLLKIKYNFIKINVQHIHIFKSRVFVVFAVMMVMVQGLHILNCIRHDL
jgi:hypothetical protein